MRGPTDADTCPGVPDAVTLRFKPLRVLWILLSVGAVVLAAEAAGADNSPPCASGDANDKTVGFAWDVSLALAAISLLIAGYLVLTGRDFKGRGGRWWFLSLALAAGLWVIGGFAALGCLR